MTKILNYHYIPEDRENAALVPAGKDGGTEIHGFNSHKELKKHLKDDRDGFVAMDYGPQGHVLRLRKSTQHEYDNSRDNNTQVFPPRSFRVTRKFPD